MVNISPDHKALFLGVRYVTCGTSVVFHNDSTTQPPEPEVVLPDDEHEPRHRFGPQMVVKSKGNGTPAISGKSR